MIVAALEVMLEADTDEKVGAVVSEATLKEIVVSEELALLWESVHLT